VGAHPLLDYAAPGSITSGDPPRLADRSDIRSRLAAHFGKELPITGVPYGYGPAVASFAAVDGQLAPVT